MKSPSPTKPVAVPPGCRGTGREAGRGRTEHACPQLSQIHRADDEGPGRCRPRSGGPSRGNPGACGQRRARQDAPEPESPPGPGQPQSVPGDRRRVTPSRKDLQEASSQTQKVGRGLGGCLTATEPRTRQREGADSRAAAHLKMPRTADFCPASLTPAFSEEAMQKPRIKNSRGNLGREEQDVRTGRCQTPQPLHRQERARAPRETIGNPMAPGQDPARRRTPGGSVTGAAAQLGVPPRDSPPTWPPASHPTHTNQLQVSGPRT